MCASTSSRRVRCRDQVAVLAHGRHRRLLGDPHRNAHALDHRVHVGRGGVVVLDDHRCLEGVGRAQPHAAPRLRPDQRRHDRPAVTRRILESLAEEHHGCEVQLHVRRRLAAGGAHERRALGDVGGEHPRRVVDEVVEVLLVLAVEQACRLVGRPHATTPGWSCRFDPTPGRSQATSIPCSARCAAGPIPESISSCGELKAPPQSTTSRAASSLTVSPSRMPSTPTARPSCSSTRVTWTPVSTDRFGRSALGCR